jgi:hypothetical protein
MLIYLENWDVSFEPHIECLLTIRSHLQITVDKLSAINGEGLLQKESCLVPMCGRGCRACLQCDIGLRAFEDCIKVHSVAMDQTRALYSMLEEKVNFLKFLQSATSLEVENKTIRGVSKIFPWIICIYYGLR